MKKNYFVFCLMCFCTFVYAKSDSVYKARISQRIAELEMQDVLSLWITDCDTGNPVKEAQIAIKDIGSTKTDADGLACFPMLDDGNYEFIISHNDYALTKDTFTVFGGSIFFNKYSIPKKVNFKCIKVILDWGKEPHDLDAHLIKENSYHISFREKVKSDDKTVWLDRDDMDSYGPETITITETDNNAIYKYYVFNWSKQKEKEGLSLSESGAKIRVYADNKQVKIYSVPKFQKGIYWNVFTIDNGIIKDVNTITQNNN